MKSAALMILATTLVAAPASAQSVKWRLIGVSFESLVPAPEYPQPSGYRYFKKPAPPYTTARLSFGVTPVSEFLARRSSSSQTPLQLAQASPAQLQSHLLEKTLPER